MKKNNHIKLSVYTTSHYTEPSSYYRINQFVDNFVDEKFDICKHYGQGDKLRQYYLSVDRNNYVKHRLIQVCCYLFWCLKLLLSLFVDNFIFKPHVVIIQRTLISRKALSVHLFLLKRLLKRSSLIWDFDDNIFENGEMDDNLKQILSIYAKKIIVTSNFLRQKIDNVSSDRFVLLPTTDGDMYQMLNQSVFNERKKRFMKEFAVVWVATASNLVYLEKVVPYIDAAAKILFERQHKKVILEVVCNKELCVNTDYLDIHNIRWDRNVAINRMLHAHLGIMPLDENEITKGKGGFKLIQYMSVGLPVIASNVGYNSEVVSSGMQGGFIFDHYSEWVECIVKMALDYDYLENMGRSSRKVWNEKFSYISNFSFWRQLIVSCAQYNF